MSVFFINHYSTIQSTLDFMDLMNFIDLLFPRQCIICWTIGEYLCKKCKTKLQPHPEICPICHRFSADYKVCLNCRSEKKIVLEGIIIPFKYDLLLKKLIMKLKYFHKKDIGGFLVERLNIALQTNESFQKKINNCPPFVKEEVPRFVGEEDLSRATLNSWSASANISPFYKERQKIIITRIPSHRYRKHFIKGYNQSEILAKKLSEVTGIPRIEIAKKKRYTKTQASLKREGRLKNLKNAFSLTPNLALIGNETLLIVDDITTTWSTINELAKCIKAHYPNIKIRWAVLGRHAG